MVTVVLPPHCRRLAGAAGPVPVTLPRGGAGGRVTVGMVLDALEAAYPVLRGLLRDGSGPLRPFIRVFAAGEDLTPAGVAAEVPRSVQEGSEPLRIVGAIAGG